MSMITEQVEELREEADFIIETLDMQYPTTIGVAKIMKRAADTIEQLAAKVRKENRTEEAKDRQENTIDKILSLIDAEAWEYCDYLLKQGIGGNADKHASAVSDNIRERLVEELPEILTNEYEKAFMDGFESHPTHSTYQKAFEDIRAELIKTSKICEPEYKDAFEVAAQIISKHNPDKGKERE